MRVGCEADTVSSLMLCATMNTELSTLSVDDARWDILRMLDRIVWYEHCLCCRLNILQGAETSERLDWQLVDGLRGRVIIRLGQQWERCRRALWHLEGL